MMKRLSRALVALAFACSPAGCAFFGGGTKVGPVPGSSSSPASGSVPAAGTPAGTPVPVAGFQKGDVLSLEIFQEPALSGEFTVDSSGRIRHPLLGDVYVAGLSPGVAERLFESRLKDGILVSPKVRVLRKATSENKARIVVNGQVAKPNEYPFFPDEKMTLRSVIARAGGLTPLAAAHRVVVIRKVNGVESRQVLNVERILAGQLADVELQPGDEIHVPDIRF